MIDEAFKIYLIEININPCLDVTSSFSSRFVTDLVENTLRIAVDPLFPPPQDFLQKKKSGELLTEIKYEIIFDQRTDGEELDNLYERVDLSKYYIIIGELIKSIEDNSEITEEEYPE